MAQHDIRSHTRITLVSCAGVTGGTSGNCATITNNVVVTPTGTLTGSNMQMTQCDNKAQHDILSHTRITLVGFAGVTGGTSGNCATINDNFVVTPTGTLTGSNMQMTGNYPPTGLQLCDIGDKQYMYAVTFTNMGQNLCTTPITVSTACIRIVGHCMGALWSNFGRSVSLPARAKSKCGDRSMQTVGMSDAQCMPALTCTCSYLFLSTISDEFHDVHSDAYCDTGTP